MVNINKMDRYVAMRKRLGEFWSVLDSNAVCYGAAIYMLIVFMIRIAGR